MMDFRAYQDMVESTLDLEQIKNHIFLIKSSHKPELEDLKIKLDEIKIRMEQLTQKAAKDLEVQSVKLESNAQNGFFFRVSRKDDVSLRENKKGINTQCFEQIFDQLVFYV
jgi:DNA mismatch repair protein MSH2